MIKLEKKYLHVSFKKWWKDFKKKCEHVLFVTMRTIMIIVLLLLLWNTGAFDKLRVPSWSEFAYLLQTAKATFIKEY